MRGGPGVPSGSPAPPRPPLWPVSPPSLPPLPSVSAARRAASCGRRRRRGARGARGRGSGRYGAACTSRRPRAARTCSRSSRPGPGTRRGAAAGSDPDPDPAPARTSDWARGCTPTPLLPSLSLASPLHARLLPGPILSLTPGLPAFCPCCPASFLAPSRFPSGLPGPCLDIDSM